MDQVKTIFGDVPLETDSDEHKEAVGEAWNRVDGHRGDGIPRAAMQAAQFAARASKALKRISEEEDIFRRALARCVTDRKQLEAKLEELLKAMRILKEAGIGLDEEQEEQLQRRMREGW